jgi:parvulin-like peptidyl-prolyl isomerase
MKRKSFAFGGLAALLLSTSPDLAADATDAGGIFATVNGVKITREEFDREVYSTARQTFYHGRAPDAEDLVEFRKGVADKLVNRKLLLEEARRREIEPDAAAVDARLTVYEDRYGGTERWQTEGPQMMAALRERFEEDSVLDPLEVDVRAVTPPDAETVKSFYDANQELFTEPAQNRVSVILIGVAPSAGATAWQAARDEAERVLAKLAEGESFAELAELHSSDMSADAGGDMGYMHSGRLSEGAEDVISELTIGEVSRPVQVLEGMGELWARQEGEKRWQELLSNLRSEARIEVDTDYLVTLPGNAD